MTTTLTVAPARHEEDRSSRAIATANLMQSGDGHGTDHLCDVDFRYSLLDEVEPSARGDGQFFGQGTGTFTGRLRGDARWANFPRVSAGYAHPDARGSIKLGDGGIVLFELHGLSNLADGSGIHVMTFETQHEPFLWLNDGIAVGEGSIDVEQQALVMRYYDCTVTHRPGVPVVSSPDTGAPAQ